MDVSMHSDLSLDLADVIASSNILCSTIRDSQWTAVDSDHRVMTADIDRALSMYTDHWPQYIFTCYYTKLIDSFCDVHKSTANPLTIPEIGYWTYRQFIFKEQQQQQLPWTPDTMSHSADSDLSDRRVGMVWIWRDWRHHRRRQPKTPSPLDKIAEQISAIGGA